MGRVLCALPCSRPVALGMALALAVACSAPPIEPPAGVVLVVFDTLRADRLSLYGHERETSPVLDALAGKGVVFEQAISPSPWTLPSLIALLSGSFPSRGVYEDGRLTRSAVEALRAAGVRTAGFTEAGFASSRFGLDLGFEHYEERAGKVAMLDPEGGEGLRGGIKATFDAAQAWLREQAGSPFFLLIHTYEPHTPYRRRFFVQGVSSGRLSGSGLELVDQARIRRGDLQLEPPELDYVRALYDGGVRVADGYLGRLLEVLEELSLSERTVVIVTSDHGEALGERDRSLVAEHGHSLYDELIRVPLFIYDPRLRDAGKVVSSQVRSLDVLPTVLELLDVVPPEGLDGRSLMPLMREEETGHRLAFSRVTRKGGPRASLRDGRFKLIRELSPDGGPAAVELYDLERDPGETTDLAPASEATVPMQQELDRFLEDLAREGPLDFAIPLDELEPELREQLRALGYLP